jgi:argonaute-like protein implicated in RNA metabolism and viral defense
MVRPATYGGKIHRFRQNGTISREIEDEASRAWNFFTALYYKAGGVPWRLTRSASDLDTCFVGVSYFRDPMDDSMQTSVAQVFNERGEGVVVRGGQALVRKDDKTVHLDAVTAEQLLANALDLYKREHKNLPARVVCHKSSYFDEGEIQGFETTIDKLGVNQIDMLSVRRSSVRLFRNKPNPPLRGTGAILDERTVLLYTQGSVDFYRAYPGLYIPRPLEIRLDSVEGQPDRVVEEVLALTKMNWNSTRFVNAEPITVAAARKVGDVLRYVSSREGIQARYSYYM